MLAWTVLTGGLLLAFVLTAGYPAFLRLVPLARRPVVKDSTCQPAVTIVVAVHNGETFLAAKIRSLLALDYPADRIRIVIVSDGSTDRTCEIARSFANHGVELIDLPRGGKAAALNAAMARTEGDIVFFTDVRQELDRNALKHLVANFADPQVGAVSGRLAILLPGSNRGEQTNLALYWRYELWVRTIHSAMDSMFSATGCIYAIRRSLLSPIPADTLSDDVVIPQRAFFRGYRIVFEPAAVAFDYPVVAGGEFRRRMRTLAGVWQVYARTPALFNLRRRMIPHFLVHRFGRLILPWVLISVFAATLALPGGAARTALLCCEVLPMFLAAADRWIPGSFPMKRIFSLSNTLIVMNGASLLSVLVFVLPAGTLWQPTRVDTSA